MNARKMSKSTKHKPGHVWHISFRTGLMGVIVASLLLVGVSCTRNDDMGDNGTVEDSNVGSVTSDATEKNTEKHSERVTEARTERQTEARTEHNSIIPGTSVPGTTPDTGTTTSQVTTEAESSAVTTVPGTNARFGSRARGGKG